MCPFKLAGQPGTEKHEKPQAYKDHKISRTRKNFDPAIEYQNALPISNQHDDKLHERIEKQPCPLAVRGLQARPRTWEKQEAGERVKDNVLESNTVHRFRVRNQVW